MISPKDIATSLEGDRSKANMLRCVAAMEKLGIDFEAFFKEVRSQSEPVCWYLTWLLSHFIEHYPALGTSIQHHVWDLLKTTAHKGMQRDLWRSLSFIHVSEELSGEIYDAACLIIPSTQQPIAVRAHAMFTARNIALPYPELCDELALILSELHHSESAGIRSRSRNILAALKKAHSTV